MSQLQEQVTDSSDPTSGRRIDTQPHDDPTQGRRVGSRFQEDPTRARRRREL